jgi:hypothetical protein
VCVGIAFGGLIAAADGAMHVPRRQVVAIWLDAAMAFPGGFLLLWAVFAWLDRHNRK